MKKAIITILILLFPLFSFAQFPTSFEITYPNIQGITLPSLPEVYEKPEVYINYIYRISIVFGVILALFSFVLGAFLYLTSAGNIGKQIEARERIWGAIAGLVLLLSSVFILRTIRPEFGRLRLASLRYPYTEIEEGVWLCRNEIRQTYQFLNHDFTLTFEMYIQSRLAIKQNWDILSREEQKAIHNLYYNVHQNCHLITFSQEIPEDFRRAQHVYIIGNYGAVFHALPNFKGPIRIITINQRLLNLDLFNPDLQDDLPNFSYFTLSDSEIPNFSVTLFKDFRLNYLDRLFNQLNPMYSSVLPNYSENIEEYAENGTTTFYTFRNFHEDLSADYQSSTSVCPSFRDPGTQSCFRTFGFRIQDFATTVQRTYTARSIDGGSQTLSFRVGVLNTTTTQVQLDPCYSLQIVLPQGDKFRGKSWWIVIARGIIPDPAPAPDPNLPFQIWALGHPFLWAEVFDKSDRDFEDNYVSYFCEDKARHKRYPCIGSAHIIPGRIIKEVER